MFIELLNKVIEKCDSVRHMKSVSEMDIDSEEKKGLLSYDELKFLRQLVEYHNDGNGSVGHLSDDDIDVLIEEFYKMR